MNSYRENIFIRVIIIHIVVLSVIFLFSGIRGCIKKKSNSEIITYIRLEDSNKNNTNQEISEKPSIIEEKKEPKSSTPKWEHTPPSEIKIGKKVSINNSSDQSIKKFTESNPTSLKNEINAYMLAIRNFFYRQWNPPVTQLSSDIVIVRIDIDKKGKILKDKMIVQSDNLGYNQSVIDLIKSIRTIPAPPNSYPYTYVEVEFKK